MCKPFKLYIIKFRPCYEWLSMISKSLQKVFVLLSVSWKRIWYKHTSGTITFALQETPKRFLWLFLCVKKGNGLLFRQKCGWRVWITFLCCITLQKYKCNIRYTTNNSSIEHYASSYHGYHYIPYEGIFLQLQSSKHSASNILSSRTNLKYCVLSSIW